MTNSCRFDFVDTKVLVTGGTSGIGFATASAFTDAGATVSYTHLDVYKRQADTD